jgi:hypothetical protein
VASKVEYQDVVRASVFKLNELGEEGWRPGALEWSPNGWSGLLWREVEKVPTFDLASEAIRTDALRR